MVSTLGWVSHDLSSERGIRQATISNQLIHTAFRTSASTLVTVCVLERHGLPAQPQHAEPSRRGSRGRRCQGGFRAFPVDAAPGPAAHT